MTVELVDAHVHFWDPQARRHAWLDAEPALRRPFGPPALDTGRHALTGVVVVEADCRDDRGLDEVAWFTALARDEPRIRGIVAFAPLDRDDVAGHLDALGDNDLVVGVRRLLQDEPASLMERPAFVAGVRELAPRGYTFDACVREGQLRALTRLAADCPDVTFVLDHLGKPTALEPWSDDLRALARRPNVACKLSGLATELGPGWTEARAAPYLRVALDAFGPDRCMFGSDWPLVTLPATHERWTDAVLAVLADAVEPERHAVLAGTAERIYDLSRRGAHAGRALHR
jgi:L-fuconolactonase